MIDQLIAQFLGHAPLQLFDLFIDEFDHTAGRKIDQMIVMVVDFLITRAAVTEIVALQDASVFEQFNGAIDGSDGDIGIDRNGAAVKLLGIGMIVGFGDNARDHAPLLRHAKPFFGASLFDAIEIQFFHEVLPGLANRHGLITGATGTGKTVTLQTLAEQFSRIGVPVFMADVKGDLTGISQAGRLSEKMAAALRERGLEAPTPVACPTTLWDVFGEQGHPVRATVSDMGPLLLSRMLNLNETQSGVLNLVFRIADEEGLLLLDMKDLRAMLQYVGDNASEFTTAYGNVSAASIGAIQRGLLQVEIGRAHV